LQGTGKQNERLGLYQRAIQHEKQALERDPQYATARDFMGEHHWALGSLLVELGRRTEAEAEQQQGLAMREKLAADFPTEQRFGGVLAQSHSALGQLFTELGRWKEAEAHCCKAQDLREKMVSGIWGFLPAALKVPVERGNSYAGLGDLVRDRRRPREALDWYAKAIAALEPVLAQEKRLVSARRTLRDAHWGRARALDLLRRHAEAVQDWERALELDDGQNRSVLHLGRTISQAHLSGDHRPCLAEAEGLARDTDGRTLEGLARLCALASVAVAEGKPKTVPASEFEEQYAARAVALLRQAAGKGHRDRLYLMEGADLAPLRSRADFQQLLAETDSKSGPRTR
jgi:tetratricopeptide (TPR) repeat protein